MKITKKTGTILIAFLFVAIFIIVWKKQLVTFFSAGSYNDVDNMVETIMDKSATPGVAMVISKDGKIDYKYYGYGDVKNQKKVTEESLFELGSTTKAFTALAIILLEDEGFITGSDPVSDYLPWFAPAYNGEQTDITIDQLLAHTSGIPSWSVQLIPEGTSDDMLEKTIRNISGITLDTYPGTKHSYATINYDILALIIEEVTGQKYQDFVTDNILLPLGMTESYFSTGQEAVSDKLTKGYKLFFGKSLEYNAPRYYGNIAAGYLVTNIKDLGLWMNAQLGLGNIPDNLRSAINKSHHVDREIAGYINEDKYYSYGWSNDIENKVIKHGGSNPNYSSQAIIDLEKQEAVFVLANLDSSVPSQIANNTYRNLNGIQMSKFSYDDSYILLDIIFSFLSIIAMLSLCRRGLNLMKGKRRVIENEETNARKIIGIAMGLVIRIIFLVFIIIWPYLINYNYYLIRVWMSNAIFVGEVLTIINCILSIAMKMKRIGAIRTRNISIPAK
ncbi:serine hydrolase domain-containing protein [Anaerocolumna aminovalerica]|uniref:serine hydrolase domain-containing protein n=1 Tax=Anaerocolumna aminovalerica TaxID=1527 RepID=UPI000BE40F7A|nr:serine hydrolase domain-containing protein [Anaerocolumna aminovalerica]